MTFRFNIAFRTGQDRINYDYTAHLEWKVRDLEKEIERLKVAAAEKEAEMIH